MSQKTIQRSGPCIYHAVVEGKHPDVPSVMNVVSSDDGVAVVFHPDACQSIVGDLVVLIYTLEREGEN